MSKGLHKLIEQKKDSLTGVYERFAIENCARKLAQENRPFSLLLIDGDNFKNVNDSYGHKVGDVVIKIIAEKIQAAFGDKALVGRFGGDEFMVVFPDVTEYDTVWHACQHVHQQFHEFSVPDYPAIYITITIGLSRMPIDGTSYDELFEKADKALYRGKQKGRSCFIIYLDEKHRDIKIHASDTPTANSMQLHNTLFTMIEKSENLKDSISYLLEFFTSNLMIDHVGIQDKKNLLFSKVYSLSRGKEFLFIDNSLVSLNVNKTTAIFYVNDVQQLVAVHQDVLIKKLEAQQIASTFWAEISYGETLYGYLRADTTTTMRIWQHSDMDLLLTAAKTIALALHYQRKTLEDL